MTAIGAFRGLQPRQSVTFVNMPLSRHDSATWLGFNGMATKRAVAARRSTPSDRSTRR
jgi:hypothetical protein